MKRFRTALVLQRYVGGSPAARVSSRQNRVELGIKLRLLGLELQLNGSIEAKTSADQQVGGQNEQAADRPAVRCFGVLRGNNVRYESGYYPNGRVYSNDQRTNAKPSGGPRLRHKDVNEFAHAPFALASLAHVGADKVDGERAVHNAQ